MQINKKTDKLEVSQINVVNFSEIKANTIHKGDIDRSFALPESKLLLKNELANSICLREINETYQVYLVEGNKSPTIMREIGRLREIAFQFVGEGTGKVWDIDDYDAYYNEMTNGTRTPFSHSRTLPPNELRTALSHALKTFQRLQEAGIPDHIVQKNASAAGLRVLQDGSLGVLDYTIEQANNMITEDHHTP